MAFIPAPGVGEIRVTGTVGPNPFAVVLHWYAGTPAAWTQSQIQALATSVTNHWTTNLVPLFAANVHFITTDTVDLTDSTERSGTTPPTSTPGGTPGMTPTLASCILVSHVIGSRYRGGHPRTYLPGSNVGNTADGDNWAAGFIGTAQTDWNAFIAGIKTDMQAAGLASNGHCCPRWTYTVSNDDLRKKYVRKRTGFMGAFPTTANSVVKQQIATQRRRLGA